MNKKQKTTYILGALALLIVVGLALFGSSEQYQGRLVREKTTRDTTTKEDTKVKRVSPRKAIKEETLVSESATVVGEITSEPIAAYPTTYTQITATTLDIPGPYVIANSERQRIFGVRLEASPAYTGPAKFVGNEGHFINMFVASQQKNLSCVLTDGTIDYDSKSSPSIGSDIIFDFSTHDLIIQPGSSKDLFLECNTKAYWNEGEIIRGGMTRQTDFINWGDDVNSSNMDKWGTVMPYAIAAPYFYAHPQLTATLLVMPGPYTVPGSTRHRIFGVQLKVNPEESSPVKFVGTQGHFIDVSLVSSQDKVNCVLTDGNTDYDSVLKPELISNLHFDFSDNDLIIQPGTAKDIYVECDTTKLSSSGDAIRGALTRQIDFMDWGDDVNAHNMDKYYGVIPYALVGQYFTFDDTARILQEGSTTIPEVEPEFTLEPAPSYTYEAEPT